jgi:hypothetical protein
MMVRILDELRAIGLAAVEQNFDRRLLCGRELAGKVLADVHDHHDILSVDRGLRRTEALVAADFGKCRGAVESADKLFGFHAPVLIEDTHRHVAHFERGRKSKQEELQQREHDQRDPCPRIAERGEQLFYNQRRDPGPDHGGCPHINRAASGSCGR